MNDPQPSVSEIDFIVVPHRDQVTAFPGLAVLCFSSSTPISIDQISRFININLRRKFTLLRRAGCKAKHPLIIRLVERIVF